LTGVQLGRPAIGECIGGGRHFWGLDRSSLGRDWPPKVGDCRPTIFLSRADLKDLERLEQEFGELIVRFLKIIFSLVGLSAQVIFGLNTTALGTTYTVIQPRRLCLAAIPMQPRHCSLRSRM